VKLRSSSASRWLNNFFERQIDYTISGMKVGWITPRPIIVRLLSENPVILIAG
jgi:hypothetical protein